MAEGEGGHEGEANGVEAQRSRVSIRPQRSGMNGLSDRPHSAAPSSYSQFGARGGKFSSAKPKSDVEWAIYRAKQCPGPGQYQFKDAEPKGGRFNLSNPKSDLDWLMKTASEMPGPGDYKVGDAPGKPTGGRFSTARPKSNLDWTIFNARQRPGPGDFRPANVRACFACSCACACCVRVLCVCVCVCVRARACVQSCARSWTSPNFRRVLRCASFRGPASTLLQLAECHASPRSIYARRALQG